MIAQSLVYEPDFWIDTIHFLLNRNLQYEQMLRMGGW